MPISEAKRARQRLNRKIKHLSSKLSQIEASLKNTLERIKKETPCKIDLRQLSEEDCLALRSFMSNESFSFVLDEDDCLAIENNIPRDKYENLDSEVESLAVQGNTKAQNIKATEKHTQPVDSQEHFEPNQSVIILHKP